MELSLTIPEADDYPRYLVFAGASAYPLFESNSLAACRRRIGKRTDCYILDTTNGNCMR